jgi:cyclopropane-fatty-acyl-phospholipid synthase
MTTKTSPAAPTIAAAAVADSKRVLEDLFSGLGERFFDVRFWDGSLWRGDSPAPRFTLVLRHPGAVRRMFWPPGDLAFNSAYVYDDFDIEGDILALPHLCRLERLVAGRSLAQKLRLAWRLWRLPRVERPRVGREQARLTGRVHSQERDREAISYHYDQPDVFFEKMLGPAMLYTSGVFDSPDESLEVAQQRKLDLICRKLRLRSGDRLLDIGCGWGMLGLFAARNYGARVVGVTLGRSQAEWARARLRAAGLEDRCRVEVADYRDLPEDEPFDRIACAEVGEHFGAEQFPTYWSKCRRLLRPGGTVLHQQITLAGHTGMGVKDRAFMHRFIFPDGELLPVNFLLRHAEQAGLEVRDVECFREHYPLTLRHWLANLESNQQELVAVTDESTYRVFRLYLAGAAWGFEMNVYNLYQLLLVKPDGTHSGLPLARSDWYR